MRSALLRTSFLDFDRKMQDLAHLLTRNVLEESILAQPLDEVSPASLRDLLRAYKESADPYIVRQAQYATQLILLYGAFERLIEDLVAGVLEALTENVSVYADLPLRIRENHRRKSLDALRDDIWLSRQEDPHLATELIQNLGSCEAQQKNYRLNSAAYARHGGNYRRQSIDEAFRDASIDELCARAAFGEPFRDYLDADTRARGFLDQDLGAIDDLAERRNEIAHGSPAQMLSTVQLMEYVEFFRAFARSAYQVLTQHLGQYLVANHATSLGSIDKVHYKTVFCPDLSSLPEGTLVQVGDPVAMYLDAGKGYLLGQITGIKSSSGATRSVRTLKGLEACLETNLRLKEGRTMYLIDRACAGAWLATPLPE